MTSNAPSNCVLITGAAKRIGRALALDFARTGWDVAIHYHSSSDDAETLVGEIEALGQRAVAIRCNLSDLKTVEQLVPRCREQLGQISCLINNASEFRFDSIG